MNALEMINQVKMIVKKDGNYINRDYKTIGGCWTVDTWMYNEVWFQLMDEGYTDRVYLKNKLDVYKNYKDDLFFKKGDINTLKEVLEGINK